MMNSEDKPPEAQNEPQQSAISSFYPLPPMRYIKDFTDQNICNKQIPLPPKPFTNGQFMMFGQNITIDDTIIRSLESQSLRRLYPREYDHKRELKKINASILVNFLDLIDVLIRCPDTQKREEKCSDLQLLFITMHHLINELRPHQARESIRVSLSVQKKQRVETTLRLNRQIERVQEICRNATSSIKEKDVEKILNETTRENFENGKKEANHVDGELPAVSGPESVGESAASPMLNFNSRMLELDAFMCGLVDEHF